MGSALAQFQSEKGDTGPTLGPVSGSRDEAMGEHLGRSSSSAQNAKVCPRGSAVPNDVGTFQGSLGNWLTAQASGRGDKDCGPGDLVSNGSMSPGKAVRAT